MQKQYEQVLNQYVVGGYSRQYIKVLQSFLSRLPSPENLSPEWIMSFLSRYDNVATRRQYHVYFKTILKKMGIEMQLPVIRFKHTMPTVERADILTDEDYDSLLRGCKDTAERAVIETLYHTGVRASELLSIRKTDVTMEDELLLITVRGKTGERTIPVPSDAMPNLLDHYAVTEEQVFDLTYIQLYYLIIRIFKRAGVRKRKRTIHIFRHTRATILATEISEALLRQFMGWSRNSDMPSIYVHLNLKSLKDAIKKLNPELAA
jgi:integrase